MKIIDVRIEWCEHNYSCVTDDEALNGVILVTDKTLEGIKSAFKKSLMFHIEGCIASGDNLPEWLLSGNYEVNYILEISALLHSLDGIITRASIARATKINPRQLGYYAVGLRIPRPRQRQRIIDAVKRISSELSSIVGQLPEI
jgi:hypothetical protein